MFVHEFLIKDYPATTANELTQMPNKILPSRTAGFYYKLTVMVFLCGLPNFWIEDLYMSRKFLKIYRNFSRVVGRLVYLLLVFELGAFLTQKNLNEKQQANLLMYGIAHPILWAYCVILSSQTEKVRRIISDLLQVKRVFSDAEVEARMIKKSKLYSAAFIFSCVLSMIMYTFDGLLQALKGATFTTIVTAWPDVKDNSSSANIFRAVWNFLWWALMTRTIGVYAFVFSLTTSLSHQFIDIQKYFYSLDNIFNNTTTGQKEKEIEYEKAFKVGLDLFVKTLNCVDQSKVICGNVFSGQIVFNIAILVIYMFQLVNSERTLMSTGAIILSAAGTLIGTGLFMCNAGDVTEEASWLATAMYCSGWQHCRGQSSINVRKLVTSSMSFAQKPVIIMGLGIMQLSYQSYVSLVKSSYSVFSVLI